MQNGFFEHSLFLRRMVACVGFWNFKLSTKPFGNTIPFGRSTRFYLVARVTNFSPRLIFQCNTVKIHASCQVVGLVGESKLTV